MHKKGDLNNNAKNIRLVSHDTASIYRHLCDVSPHRCQNSALICWTQLFSYPDIQTVFLMAEYQQAFTFSKANICVYPFSFTDCCVPGSTSSRVMGYGIHTQYWLLFQRSFICAHASGPVVWAPERLNLSCRRVRLQSHESWHEKTFQISLKRLKKEQRHLSQQNWNILILVILPSEARRKTAPGLKSLGDRSSALRWTDPTADRLHPEFWTLILSSLSCLLLVTAGITCMFTKCHRLRARGDQVEGEELTPGVKTALSNWELKKPPKTSGSVMDVSYCSRLAVSQLQIYLLLYITAIYSLQADAGDVFSISRD